MKKIKKNASEISRISRDYLYRRFLMLYLHSGQARRRFAYRILVQKPHKAKRRTAKKSDRKVYSLKTDYVRLQKVYRHSAFIRTAVVMGILIAIQFVYPSDRALPFARLQSNGYVGFNSITEISHKFQNFDTRIVTVHTHNRSFTTSYADLGVKPNTDATIDKLSNYPLKQRLIPFSIFFVGNQTQSAARDLDESRLTLYVNDIIDQTSKQPVDAVITMQGTKLAVTPAEDGYEYQKAELKSQVLRADLSDKASIVFSPTILHPKVSTGTASDDANRMQHRIDKPLSIQSEGRIMTIDSTTLASWIDITPNPEKGRIELTFNKGRVANSIKPFAGMVDVAGTPTVVTLLNGVEAGRSVGVTGKILQFNELVEQVASTTSYATTTVEAKVTSVIPKITYDRRYSKDSTGVQNLLKYWTDNHKGQYGIDFRSLNGKIEANVNPHRQFTSVGIYRLFIVHQVYGRINSGTLKGSNPTTTGHSVDTCIDKMMRESEEACSRALGDIIGWSANDSMLHTQGFESTTLAGGTGPTTANDASDWLYKLLNSSITTKAQADSLINQMSRSTARSGLPSGIPGLKVANKAGSFGGVRHDVGVVYNPRGTYVLSILSEGSSFDQIADLAREINKIMSQ